MKTHFFARTFLVIAALLISILSCHAQDDSSKPVVGKWTKSSGESVSEFTMTADNRYEVEFTGDDVIDVLGSYEIAKNQITFSDDGGDYSSIEPGVYEFKVTETTITFTSVDDPTDGRRMLVEGTWSKATEAP